jgi:hypothetical protein
VSQFAAWVCLLLAAAGMCGVVLCRELLHQIVCAHAVVIALSAVFGAILDAKVRDDGR